MPRSSAPAHTDSGATLPAACDIYGQTAPVPSLAEGYDIYGRRQGYQQNATQSDRPDDKFSPPKSARPYDCFSL